MPGAIAGFGTEIDTDSLYRRVALLESRSQDPSNVAITGGSIATAVLANLAGNGADNTATLNAAVAAVPLGGTLILPAGTFKGSLTLTKSIRVIGSGKPWYNGATLQGGTVLQGAVSAYVNGCELGFFGVDQSGTTDGDGIVSGSSTQTDNLDLWFHDLAVLGRGSASGSTHGIISQSGRRVVIQRCDSYKWTHGIAARVSYGLVDACYVEDCDTSSVIVKAGTTTPANDCFHTRVTNCMAVAKTAGKVAVFFANTGNSGATTSNVSFTNCVSVGSAAIPFITQNDGGTGGTGLRNIQFTGCRVFGTTATRGFSFVHGDDILVNMCHVDDGPTYSFGGDGATNVRLIDCTSRSPVTGHLTGTFSEAKVNGAWTGLQIPGVANSVNGVQINGTATGAGTTGLAAYGTDAALSLGYYAKGAANHYFYNNGTVVQAAIAGGASSVNYPVLAGAGTGGPAQLFAQGADVNIPVQIANKGTSVTQFLGQTTGTTVGAAGAAAALPAAPLGYLTLNVNGSNVRLPYYN